MTYIIFGFSLFAFILFYVFRYRTDKKKWFGVVFLFLSIALIVLGIFYMNRQKEIISLNLNDHIVKVYFPTEAAKSHIDDYGDMYTSKTEFGVYRATLSLLGPENNIDVLIDTTDKEYESVNWTQNENGMVSVDYEAESNDVPIHIYLTAYEINEYLLSLYVIYRSGNNDIEESFSQFMAPKITIK